MVQLYRSGQSLAIVRERFEVDPSTVRLHLHRLRVEMRDTHGRERPESAVIERSILGELKQHAQNP